MNAQNESSPEPNDDRLLEDMLSHLKRLEPPLAARVANRQAVTAALGSLNAANPQRHLPWWRCSVSIPVPFAVALVLVMAVAFYSSFHNWHERSAQPAEGAKTALGHEAPVTKPVPTTYATLKYYETETYLCGVGRVNSESYYASKE